MDVRNVLFPTDFSEVSARAGRVAAAMAREAGARLHVLHVCPSHWDHVSAAEGVDAVADGLTGSGIETETALSTGPPAAQIIRYAREHAIDLIVLATHGRTGVSHALLGSVAEAVVRRAPCPVLTIPARAAAEAIAAPPPTGEASPSTCIVCATSAEELICGACRDRIRAEASAAERAPEQAGRQGSPA